RPTKKEPVLRDSFFSSIRRIAADLGLYHCSSAFRGGDQCSDFGWRKRAVLTDLEPGNSNRPDPRPDQLEDLGAERLHHSSHLPVPALGNCDFKKRVAGGIADVIDGGWARGPIRKRDALAQSVELLLAQSRRSLHQVGFGDLR